MYYCPRGCETTSPAAFTVEEHTIGLAMLNADGTETAFVPDRRERVGRVKCATCDALAEYRDVSQGELFALAPTLEDSLA